MDIHLILNILDFNMQRDFHLGEHNDLNNSLALFSACLTYPRLKEFQPWVEKEKIGTRCEIKTCIEFA